MTTPNSERTLPEGGAIIGATLPTATFIVAIVPSGGKFIWERILDHNLAAAGFLWTPNIKEKIDALKKDIAKHCGAGTGLLLGIDDSCNEENGFFPTEYLKGIMFAGQDSLYLYATPTTNRVGFCMTLHLRRCQAIAVWPLG
jgi:hypothetical protein